MSDTPRDAAANDAISRREFNRRLGAAAVGAALLPPFDAVAPQDLCFLPATELVAMMRSKKVSAREVMQAHLAQIDRVNP
jgi:hypothetical protein